MAAHLKISLLILAAATLALSAPLHAKDYHLVIKGGRVMDPESTCNEAANVGIRAMQERGRLRKGKVADTF